MKLLAILLGVLALTACGGSKSSSATDVVRAWSAALDRNDNEQAARLFADGAQVVQNGEETLLTHADAVRWNAGLPCGGRISHPSVLDRYRAIPATRRWLGWATVALFALTFMPAAFPMRPFHI